MKILAVGTELFNADGLTDSRTGQTDSHDEANSRF
jgi:hypothetical protein